MKDNEFYKGICFNHSGKMEGMYSYSTACTNNALCLARMKDKNSICSHCFACALCKCRKTTEAKCIRNGEYIKNHLMFKDELPIINASFFRFESFGDLENITQCMNYFNVCKKNPETHFALWTKNPDIVSATIKAKNRKPKNLIIVYSSPELNIPDISTFDKYDFLDKLFTVYEKDYATKHNVKINCGANHCLSCKQCYLRNGVTFINEQLK